MKKLDKIKSLNPKVYENLEIITSFDGSAGNGQTAQGGKFSFAKIIDDSKE